MVFDRLSRLGWGRMRRRKPIRQWRANCAHFGKRSLIFERPWTQVNHRSLGQLREFQHNASPMICAAHSMRSRARTPAARCVRRTWRCCTIVSSASLENICCRFTPRTMSGSMRSQQVFHPAVRARSSWPARVDRAPTELYLRYHHPAQGQLPAGRVVCIGRHCHHGLLPFQIPGLRDSYPCCAVAIGTVWLLGFMGLTGIVVQPGRHHDRFRW